MAKVSLENLAEIAGARVENAPESSLSVSAISLDSNAVKSGAMFAALPGTRVHGATFAHASDASAVLTDDAGWDILRETGFERPVLVVERVRDILGDVAAEIYGHPTEHLTVIGVTGTSGKTTTTYLLESGLTAAGCAVGLIGTTGTRIKGEDVPTSLTTPEAPKLQELFADMVSRGVTHVVMEVSSHALVLGRVDGTKFAAAGFTNLSQDHLDFHPTMEDYFEAKAILFDRAEKAVVCIDDEWGQKMTQRAHSPVTVGVHNTSADCTARLDSVTESGAQDITVRIGGQDISTRIPLPGAFNIANTALATALADSVGIDPKVFLQGLDAARVPGRMERVSVGQPFVAVVDYAHKPAAVAAALDSLREQVDGRIGVVVGAGGDRDHSKRPLMGAEAATRADLVIITDDNPRTEDPATIRAAVKQGAESVIDGAATDIREVASRAQAIADLVAWAEPGDAIIVVGKGHEVGQIIGETTHHFDDREEVAFALARREGKEVKE
ncbi:UDP-N-acetylmuramoyl-L-alanyl-D-glutamate--2,6-diaminopimelate ligase [Corynebacterium sp. CCUG 70398]|uniref:UDP-N-acetylmuramoyl-L-alanyl-D-glutamate--2, 6-diaminopimelate ligase n=1 Tax=Corynebacterium sp. CCUG 70398 TaxID=2823891 RepID=UPI00210E21ED|nr:UDP-N-acetylmuramoyl-L-alanyl-D-glutamate--2,6-diaminopimelate ligase [Corynebacterium sp. CCUG 70398]MCQ4622734.1 UDP-N-acetylmuramoyl-L-alanyl-D-glutamate--2,6-diaminopimelate ligase [Corynebacterium sp. CCUG 70398]